MSIAASKGGTDVTNIVLRGFDKRGIDVINEYNYVFSAVMSEKGFPHLVCVSVAKASEVKAVDKSAYH